MSSSSKARWAVAGATGLVGEALRDLLENAGHEVVRLVRGAPRRPGDVSWDPDAGRLEATALDGVDVVVNLAGENVAGGRWTDERKAAILESRVRSTRLLASTVAALPRRPAALVNASAIGIYGDRGDEELDESSTSGSGFLADVCRAWEMATLPAEDAGVRTARARFGVVLSARGGALAKMLTPFKLGAGGPVGSGKQWMSVVSLDDAAAALRFLGVTAVAGPVNVVCPTPLRQADFARALGRAVGRPAVVPLPAFAVKAALGEMGKEMLLGSQRVTPRALIDAGFTFAHRDAAAALGAALRR